MLTAFHHLFWWVLCKSEVVTNILDLVSLSFMTPEIVGTARLKVLVEAPRRWLVTLYTTRDTTRIRMMNFVGRAFLITLLFLFVAVFFGTAYEVHLAFQGRYPTSLDRRINVLLPLIGGS